MSCRQRAMRSSSRGVVPTYPAMPHIASAHENAVALHDPSRTVGERREEERGSEAPLAQRGEHVEVARLTLIRRLERQLDLDGDEAVERRRGAAKHLQVEALRVHLQEDQACTT